MTRWPSRSYCFGAVPPEVSGDVVVESAGGVVVASPGAGGVVDESGAAVESEGMLDESAGGVVLGSVVVDSAGAFGAVAFCFEQAAVNANAPMQSRRTLRFI